METFSALLAICVGNSPVTGEFPAQRPVRRCFDVFFDLRLNKRLSKQSWGWWFETPLRSLWRHCSDEYQHISNGFKMSVQWFLKHSTLFEFGSDQSDSFNKKNLWIMQEYTLIISDIGISGYPFRWESYLTGGVSFTVHVCHLQTDETLFLMRDNFLKFIVTRKQDPLISVFQILLGWH